MKPKLTHLLIALMLAAPMPAYAQSAPGSARDFQLQPSPTPTPDNTPEVQGPVDSDAPISTRPREISGSNDQTEPQPAPSAAETASTVGTPVVQPVPTTTAAQSSRTITPTNRPTPQRDAPLEPLPANPDPDIAATGAASEELIDLPANVEPSENVNSAAPPQLDAGLPSSDTSITPIYVWWLAALSALILLLIGGAFWWNRRAPSAASVPTIEPPLVRVKNDSAASDPAVDATTDGLSAQDVKLASLPIQIKAEAVSLSRSMMNTALTYKFEFMNIGNADLEDISISGDMITAHGKAPIDEQVAHEKSELPFIGLIAGIKKDSSQKLTGELRLPVRDIRWIAQGQAKLYIPLVRLRVHADGTAPMIHTFVVGIRPEAKNGKLLPFRLDEMAQTYRAIGFRALD